MKKVRRLRQKIKDVRQFAEDLQDDLIDLKATVESSETRRIENREHAGRLEIRISKLELKLHDIEQWILGNAGQPTKTKRQVPLTPDQIRAKSERS